jgi:hypothetical protein
MSSAHARFATRAEIMKLARMLGTEPTELSYLEHVPAEDLRELREQVTAVFFDSDGGGTLGRLAAASRVLPVAVVAKIAEGAFGPVLAARLAGLLDPGRAADVAARLPTSFLAEVAVHLDPRRASDLLARIPPERIAEVAAILVAQAEHVTLGRFVGHLPDQAIVLALREMDDLTVLRVAFVLEDLGSIDRVLGLIEQSRLDALVDAAVGTELWPDVLELVAEVGEPQRTRVLGSRRASGGAAA